MAGATEAIMVLGGLGIAAYVLTQTDILSQLSGGGGAAPPPPDTEAPPEGDQAPKEGEGEGEDGMGPGGIQVEHGEGYGDEDEEYGQFDPSFMDPSRREYRDLCLSRRGCVWLSVPGRGNSFCSCNPNEHRRVRKPMGQSACFRLGGFWNGRYCTYYVPFPYGGGPAPVFPPMRPRPGCPIPENYGRFPGDGCPPGTQNRFHCCTPVGGMPGYPRPGYPWYPWWPYPTAPAWWYDPRAPPWWRGPWPYRPGYAYPKFGPPPGWKYPGPGPRPGPGPGPGPGFPRPRPGPPGPPGPIGGSGRVCTPYRPGNPEWVAGKGGRCCEQRRNLGRWERTCWEYGRSVSLGDAHRVPSALAKPNGCVGCPPGPQPPSPNVYPGSGSSNDPGREDRGQPANQVVPETPTSQWGLYY